MQTIELPKTVNNVAIGGGTIEDAFEAYFKTGGARNKVRWNGKCTLAKFRKEFGASFKSVSVPATPQEAASNMLALLDAATIAQLDANTIVTLANTPVGTQAQRDEDGDAAQETAAEAAKRRAVKPENRNEVPTSGMTYLLLKAGQEAGISTSVKIPVFRGACSELIGKVKAAREANDMPKVRRLLGA
jgi:hypothetical protein